MVSIFLLDITGLEGSERELETVTATIEKINQQVITKFEDFYNFRDTCRIFSNSDE